MQRDPLHTRESEWGASKSPVPKLTYFFCFSQNRVRLSDIKRPEDEEDDLEEQHQHQQLQQHQLSFARDEDDPAAGPSHRYFFKVSILISPTNIEVFFAGERNLLPLRLQALPPPPPLLCPARSAWW